jgi:hypothetical protein
MSARDGAASVQGEVARITPLNIDGSIDANSPVLTTEGWISASFSSEFEDGEEITEKAANGKICIQYQTDDSMKGITFNLSLCSPDPEAAALLAGGKVICDPDNGEVVGYSSPAVGDIVGNPVAVEIWSKAIVGGKPAAGEPYWHWVFPYVRVRFDGDREFSNGALANEFSGTGVGNGALVPVGLNPINVDDDFVKYRSALINPFSYVRTANIAPAGWSGNFVPTPDNSFGCGAEPPEATGYIAPSVGLVWALAPVGAVWPAEITDLATLKADPVLGDGGTGAPSRDFTTGEHLIGPDAGAHVNYDTGVWASGDAV